MLCLKDSRLISRMREGHEGGLGLRVSVQELISSRREVQSLLFSREMAGGDVHEREAGRFAYWVRSQAWQG